MALKDSPVAGLFPPLRPTPSLSPSTSNRPCTVRVLPLRPFFFGNSGGARRVNELRLAWGNRLKCSGLGVGGAGVMMNLFEHFSRVFKVLASQKQLEDRYKAAKQSSDDWYKRAQLALAKGDKDLAGRLAICHSTTCCFFG